jgi:hypothetical protein
MLRIMLVPGVWLTHSLLDPLPGLFEAEIEKTLLAGTAVLALSGRWSVEREKLRGLNVHRFSRN